MTLVLTTQYSHRNGAFPSWKGVLLYVFSPDASSKLNGDNVEPTRGFNTSLNGENEPGFHSGKIIIENEKKK